MQLENIHIKRLESLCSPRQLKDQLPGNEYVHKVVFDARNTIIDILSGKDRRILGVVGPCSIHDKASALEYATKLKVLRDSVSDVMYLIMRVYFEKPRTTIGWRGLLIDPDMNNSNNIAKGIALGRDILLEINQMGIPAGSEYLDPVVPNYVDDLVCWASIGARTIESQTHRDMASGVSVPVGFKNSTSGDVSNAVNAMVLSATERGFIGIDSEGDTCIVHTTGNPHTHLILRGGDSGPNYFPAHIEKASNVMEGMNVVPRIMIDCSHGNSLKNYKNQARVLFSVIDQVIAGEERIIGFMLESNLVAGAQALTGDIVDLEYGKSITDECMGMKDTEEIIRHAHELLVKYDYMRTFNHYGITV